MDYAGNVWSLDRRVLDGEWNGNLYSAEEMIQYARKHGEELGMQETLQALDFAVRSHQGQFRKCLAAYGKKNPYIVHPLTMLLHAWALGWEEDLLGATILLHDVCEDCGVAPKELPVSEVVQQAVELLTKTDDFYRNLSFGSEEEYYRRIQENRLALITKLLDRCHNISGMASGFARERMMDYIQKTETDFYPMLDHAQNCFPKDKYRWFLIRYHMYSVIESLRVLIGSGEDIH